MGVLSVYHMDIEDFITAKSKDSNTLKHFNISVMVDDDFIKKAENDEEYYVHHPVYDEDGSILNNPEKWVYSKKVSAKKVWNMIIEQAYNYGEPGVLFYDTMNRDNNLWYIEKINATNPCFTGDMSLLTEDGYMTFKELCDRNDVSVICPDGTVSHNNRVWCSGIKETVKVIFENNEFVKCTPNHVFMLKDGTECEAKDLCGKRVRTFYPEESTRVIRIEKSKYEPVYDFTENDNHWGIVNGYIVHNCGEYLSGTVYGNDPKTGEKLDRHAFGGSCNLGSLFLHNYVVNPFKKDAYINYDKLGYAVSVAVNFLDNIIDVNTYPDKIYENYQKHFRTIGLGITGLADCLAMLGIRYDSDEAIKKTDEIMDFITLNAYKSSIELAKKKGAFPYLDKMKFINSGYLSKKVKNQAWADVANDIVVYGIRNAKLISVAPVGTLSLTYGNNCSSGMEPIFSLSYDRKVKIGGQDDSNIQIVTLKDYAYSVWESMDGGDFPDKDSIFITALELDVNKKIDMLATIAKHVDMSVSNTLNIPEEYTFEQVKDVYKRSWELGIKGCTIFRPNKLRQGVFVTDNNKENKDTRELKRGEIVPCSNDLIIKKRKLVSGCGSLHVIACFDKENGELRETYLSKGSTGGCGNFMNGLSRALSLLGRAGVSIYDIVDQMNSTGSCPSYAVRRATKHDASPGACCPMAAGNAILDMYNEVREELKTKKVHNNNENCEECHDPESVIETKTKQKCPECGESLDFEGGCVTCRSCGYTKCG